MGSTFDCRVTVLLELLSELLLPSPGDLGFGLLSSEALLPLSRRSIASVPAEEAELLEDEEALGVSEASGAGDEGVLGALSVVGCDVLDVCAGISLGSCSMQCIHA